MATPTIRQGVGGFSSSQTSAAISATLPSAAIAGNLLVFCIAGDKNTGALTLSGWNVSNTAALALNSSSVSLYIAWKVAAGGETTVSGSTGTAPVSGNSWYLMEISQAGSGSWAVQARAENNSDGTTAVSTLRIPATGNTTPTAPFEGLAVAAAAVDSMSSFTMSGSPTWTTAGFTHQFTGDLSGPTGSGGGLAGIFVGTGAVAAGGATFVTFDPTTGAGSDQISGGILVFGRNAPPTTDVNAGNAAATPAAQTAQSGVSASAVAAVANPVAGQDPSGGVGASAVAATATPAGQDATSAVAASAVEATATPAGQDAAVVTGTFVAAGSAAGSAAGLDATVSVTAAAGAAAVTVTGQDAVGDTGFVGNPVDVIPFGTAAGLVHYAFDISEDGAGSRVLYPPSDLAAGLSFDPEFKAVFDSGKPWVQCSARADSPTTSGTQNAREEGRETQEGSDSNLAFSPTDGGTHWQRFRCRIMEQPTVQGAGIATGQLHSLADDTVMVRTRYYTSDGTNRLVLKVYDPGTGDTADVLVLDPDYTFGDTYDVMFLIKGGYCHIFYQDFVQYAYRFPVSILPVTGTYLLKWGDYNQFNETTAGVNPTDRGRVLYRNVMHHHPGWATPTNYPGVPEVTLGAAGSASVAQAFTRTASETGTGITARKWAILDGPVGAGTTIGTAAALNWTPTVAGAYTLMYAAQNDEGWSNPTFLDVSVGPASGGPPASVNSTVTGATNTASLTHAVTMPTRAVGEALLVGFANDESAGATTAAPDAASIARGWTTLGSTEQGTSTNHRFSVFYKAAAGGGSADDLTVELAFAQEATWAAMSITGAGGAPSIVGDDGGSSVNAVVAAHTGLAAGEWLSIVLLGTDASTTIVQDPTLTNWTRTALQNPTVTSSAATAAFTRTMPAGTTSISPGTITILAEQWVTFHVAFPPGAPLTSPPTVDAGVDAGIDLGQQFTRTATENDGGDAITAREWAILSGPGEGTVLATTAALAWTPTVGATYVLRYTAINGQGADSDDLVLTVTVVAVGVTPTTAGITGPAQDAAAATAATADAATVLVVGVDGSAGLSSPADAAAAVADGQAAYAGVNPNPTPAVYTVAGEDATATAVAVADAHAGTADATANGGDLAPVVASSAGPAGGNAAALDVSSAVAASPLESPFLLGGAGPAAAPGVNAETAPVAGGVSQPDLIVGSGPSTAAVGVLAADASPVTAAAPDAAGLAVDGGPATSLAGQFATPGAATLDVGGLDAEHDVSAPTGPAALTTAAPDAGTTSTSTPGPASVVAEAEAAVVETQNTTQTVADAAAVDVLARGATGDQTVTGIAEVADHTVAAGDADTARTVGVVSTTAGYTVGAQPAGVTAATTTVAAAASTAALGPSSAVVASVEAGGIAATGEDIDVDTSGLIDVDPDPAITTVGSGVPSVRIVAGADLGSVGFAAPGSGHEVGATPPQAQAYVSGAQFTADTDASAGIGAPAPTVETTFQAPDPTPFTQGGTVPHPQTAAAAIAADGPAPGVAADARVAAPVVAGPQPTSALTPGAAAAVVALTAEQPPTAVVTRAGAGATDVDADLPGLGVTGQRDVAPDAAQISPVVAHPATPRISTRATAGHAGVDPEATDAGTTATSTPGAATVSASAPAPSTAVTPPTQPPAGIGMAGQDAASSAEAVTQPRPGPAGMGIAPQPATFDVRAHIEAAGLDLSGLDGIGAVYRDAFADAAAAVLAALPVEHRVEPSALVALVVVAALDAVAQVPILRGTLTEETPPRPTIEETWRAHGLTDAILQITEWGRAHAVAEQWERR